MAKKKTNRSTIIKLYVVLVVAELIASALDILYGYTLLMQVLMASIMPCLMLYLITSVKQKKWPIHLKLVLVALFFSWVGDIFFAFDDSSIVKLFLFGLIAAFISNMAYIVAFRKVTRKRTSLIIKNKPEWIFAIALFGFAFIYSLNILRYKFFGEVQIPVIIYTLTVVGLFLSALSRENRVNEESYQFVLIGAFLFITGACLSALNIFTTVFSNIEIIGGILIVCFYSTGQYLMVEGSLKQDG